MIYIYNPIIEEREECTFSFQYRTPDPDELTIEDTAVADRLYNEVRLTCFVMTTKKQLPNRVPFAHDTWARRCNRVVYMSSLKGMHHSIKMINILNSHNPCSSLPFARQTRRKCGRDTWQRFHMGQNAPHLATPVQNVSQRYRLFPACRRRVVHNSGECQAYAVSVLAGRCAVLWQRISTAQCNDEIYTNSNILNRNR